MCCSCAGCLWLCWNCCVRKLYSYQCPCTFFHTDIVHFFANCLSYIILLSPPVPMSPEINVKASALPSNCFITYSSAPHRSGSSLQSPKLISILFLHASSQVRCMRPRVWHLSAWSLLFSTCLCILRCFLSSPWVVNAWRRWVSWACASCRKVRVCLCVCLCHAVYLWGLCKRQRWTSVIVSTIIACVWGLCKQQKGWQVLRACAVRGEWEGTSTCRWVFSVLRSGGCSLKAA